MAIRQIQGAYGVMYIQLELGMCCKPFRITYSSAKAVCTKMPTELKKNVGIRAHEISFRPGSVCKYS